MDEFEKKSIKQKRLEKGKEAYKIFEEVFDRSTLMVLYKFLNHGYIDQVNGAVSTGKEANVYHAVDVKGSNVAVKIYRITTEFSKWNYLASDPRFRRVKKDSRNITFAWAKREFSNLKKMENVLDSPKPIVHEKNVVLMEFLGENGVPYPKLKEVGSESPEEDFFKIVGDLKKMLEYKFVHGDLSEYNILVGEKLYLIDFAQGTTLENPNSFEYLLRDVKNICRYFKKYLKISLEDVWEEIGGKKIFGPLREFPIN